MEMRTEPHQPIVIDVVSLITRYHCLLLDAYGVLVDKAGALPGAAELIGYLNATSKPYYVLSNSASSLPERMVNSLRAVGLHLSKDRLITAGGLLKPYFQRQGLTGRRCIVLGTEDSKQYVLRAGGVVVSPELGQPVEGVIIADQSGFPLLQVLDKTLTIILRQLDRGEAIHLVLCNPDLIYPRAPGCYGFTAGGLAAMLEAVLHQRYPGHAVGFVRLGKPYRPIFDEAVCRAGTRDMVMLGDQLATDILGAQRFGIDSALVATGLALTSAGRLGHGIVPQYVLPSLELRV